MHFAKATILYEKWIGRREERKLENQLDYAYSLDEKGYELKAGWWKSMENFKANLQYT